MRLTRLPVAALVIGTMVVASAATFGPARFEQFVAANPLIHDITTDPVDPPRIVAGAAMLRDNTPDYVGAQEAPFSDLTVTEAQQQAYPGVRPMIIKVSLDEAVKHVQSVLTEMEMDILRVDHPAPDQAASIEAAYTSSWFGFVDDFVVRLTPQADSLRVDVRSKSRVGVSDLGANADRIRVFFSKLRERIPAVQGQ